MQLGTGCLRAGFVASTSPLGLGEVQQTALALFTIPQLYAFGATAPPLSNMAARAFIFARRASASALAAFSFSSLRKYWTYL